MLPLRDRFDEAVENFKTNEIVKRVKQHVTENKKAYITLLVSQELYGQSMRRTAKCMRQRILGVGTSFFI